MKIRNILLPLTILIGLMTAVALPALARPVHQSASCSIDFEATVRLGANTNTSIVGTWTFELDDKDGLTGQITTDQATYPVVGQVTGRAINLAIEYKPASDSADGMYIFGTGTAWNDVHGDDCGGVLGGTFGGPQAGDIGDWLTVCGRKDLYNCRGS